MRMHITRCLPKTKGLVADLNEEILELYANLAGIAETIPRACLLDEFLGVETLKIRFEELLPIALITGFFTDQLIHLELCLRIPTLDMNQYMHQMPSIKTLRLSHCHLSRLDPPPGIEEIHLEAHLEALHNTGVFVVNLFPNSNLNSLTIKKDHNKAVPDEGLRITTVDKSYSPLVSLKYFDCSLPLRNSLDSLLSHSSGLTTLCCIYWSDRFSMYFDSRQLKNIVFYKPVLGDFAVR
eukprot:CAMPEP_0114993660 /NCGR_PEP_ID=MMETSP0216-20121206/12663_1 /TAXON_ID=223996 /ORGANISM="Protocruzia adherens, Strain Boccale" /LENGTH=237 /DNA_ID=CAMNT_0002357347 /DNA_START=148 /DNA_END=857 /DNA_ORIENTATION=+